MAEVVNDPDRVTHPLRRAAGGGFERVGWDEALGDIAAAPRGRARDVIVVALSQVDTGHGGG